MRINNTNGDNMNNKPLTNNKIDRIISMDEVATILNRSSKTLWRWHAKKK